MEMEKKDLRRFYAERRKSIPAEQRQSFDRAIRQNLRELPLFSRSTCVAAFCPLGAEPDLLPVLGEKRLFLPRFAEEQQAYELVEVTDLQKDLVTGRYKIAEPRPELEKADWFLRLPMTAGESDWVAEAVFMTVCSAPLQNLRWELFTPARLERDCRCAVMTSLSDGSSQRVKLLTV